MSAPNPGAVPEAAGLVGQGSDEARTAVRLQRDLKRKKDGLRKAEKKLKTLKNDEVAVKAATEEIKKLTDEIAALEATLTESSGAREEPQAAAAAAATTSLSTAAATNNNNNNNNNEKNANATGNASPGAHGASSGEAKRQTAAKPPGKGKTPKQVGADQQVGSASAKSPETAESAEDARHDLMERVRREIERATPLPSLPAAVKRSENLLVHYQVAELAHMMESMMLVGGNARTFAMIEALKALLRATPLLSGSSLRDTNPKEFEKLINVNFEFLRRSREPAAGMTQVKESLVRRVVALLSPGEKLFFSSDALRSLTQSPLIAENPPLPSSPSFSLNRNESNLIDGDPRELALDVLGGIEKELQLSIKSIVEDRSLPYISSNDTILVFGRSSTVEQILLAAASNARLVVKPKVIVVDAAPLYEGRALAKRLSGSGLSVTYGLITACCTLLPRCTRVFIGASAVLQNGDVFGRCGTAVVVASAKRYRKPVLCFSESLKFVPEVWLGNLGQNTKLTDVGQTHEQNRCSPGGWNSPSRSPEAEGRPWNRGEEHPYTRLSASVSASGYLYDLTPAAYIDMIICEMGCLHTSAIVAALRDREDRDANLISAA